MEKKYYITKQDNFILLMNEEIKKIRQNTLEFNRIFTNSICKSVVGLAIQHKERLNALPISIVNQKNNKMVIKK